MTDLTFLTNKQIFGNEKLDILKIYGTKCAITDFSILLGGELIKNNYTKERDNFIGHWWTKTTYENNVLIVYGNGSSYFNITKNRTTGARVALSFSSISSLFLNIERRINGIFEVEYGEYPQTVVSETFSKILETEFSNIPYSNTKMKITGKNYTTDSIDYHDIDTPFKARTHIEYEYDGKKYIRFVGDLNCNGEVLSDGRIIHYGNIYWVEVEPIKWMIDERTNIALSKKIIFSGVQFDFEKNYEGYFNKTNIKKFIDNYFSKDIIPSNINEELNEEVNTSRISELSCNERINDTKKLIKTYK